MAAFAAAEGGDGERARLELARDPFSFERERKQRGAERAAEMWTALRPVETTERETAALQPGEVDIDACGAEGFCAGVGEIVGIAAALGDQPALRQEAIVQADGDGSGEVVVATARGAQMHRCGRRERAARRTGKHAEAFKRASDGRRCERVVAVATLHEDVDEVVILQAAEVHAGRGRRDAGDESQFGAGARRAFHQAEEHARAGRLADGGSDAGDVCVDG